MSRRGHTSPVPVERAWAPDGQASDDSVGRWLARYDAGDVEAWARLREEAARMVRQLAGGRRRIAQDAEDLADVLVIEQLARGCADLRRARPKTGLRAWLRGVLRHKIAASAARARRAGGPVDPAHLEQRGASPPEADVSPHGARPSRIAELDIESLPPRQRDALAVLRRAASLREAARTDGVEWRTYRERLARAIHNLRTDAAEPEDRSWAVVLAGRLTASGDAKSAAILCAWHSGRSHKETAGVVGAGLTASAVRGRVYRLRLRAAALGLTAPRRTR